MDFQVLAETTLCRSENNLKICRGVVAPIETAVTYKQSRPGENQGYLYSRIKNPTRDVLDECLASLDNAKYCLTYASGLAAVTGILATLKSGDGIVTTPNLYGGTTRLFNELAIKFGVEIHYIDFDDVKNLESSLKSNTKLVWVETPTNPILTVVDIKLIAEIVHTKSKALLVVDNTFLTPYFQRPLELGADVVMYSLTKFMNGHADVIMGSVVTNNDKFYETLRFFKVSTGMVPSPRDCFEVIRSLKTLPVRMEQHFQNSYAVAQFLNAHPRVEKVFHPALKTHAKHDIVLKQSYGHSGIMSFYIKGGLEESKRFFRCLKLIYPAESLGGVESTASFPWTLSHSDMPEKERIKAGVTNYLIRLSVGLEDVKEIIADLDQALMNMQNSKL